MKWMHRGQNSLWLLVALILLALLALWWRQRRRARC
jgi:LPXTG-motif cell wall-anchored protein